MVDKVTQKGFEKILRERIEKPHNLGDKLYLVINGNSRDFSFRYTKNKKTRKYSLKRYHPQTNTLADARRRAIELNAMIANGLDPHEEKKIKSDLDYKAKKDREIADKLKDNTFSKYAYQHIKNLEPSWTNAKTSAQWRSSLEHYAFPVIGDTPVSDISRTQVLEILQPIWIEKTETADRVRRRIAAILDVAISDDLRIERNPAVWRGSLHGKLPSVESVKKAKAPTEERAHASLHYADLPMFMEALVEQDGMGARALEFCILNANRTTEVLDATWDEFDLEEGIWSIPARRMKGRERHNIPLSKQSIALIKQQQQLRMSEFVFPNRSNGKGLSQAGMSSVLKRMNKIKEWKDIHGQLITVHGFRGCFKTWTTEKTDTDWLTGEMALAHKIKDKSSATYQKGQLIDKRRRLMQKYSDYAYTTPQTKVVPIAG
ncbi:tyrosine-type recombinase/integrase [Porticoccaceae bacterium]|nr:tyrosine-type recombinase/integrase [Porticoccaceae bacterium]